MTLFETNRLYIEEADLLHELTVFSNLETHNTQMIREGKDKEERFRILKEIAAYQMDILTRADRIVKIEQP